MNKCLAYLVLKQKLLRNNLRVKRYLIAVCKDFLVGASDFIPGVSEAKDTAELVRSVSEKDLVGTGIRNTSLLLGTIPFAGDTLRKALRSSVDPIKTKKAYKLFVQRDGKLYPLFVI